jgi:small subunit ribosomal protein S16
MLKIRLSRHGKKRKPSYRVVVADAEAPRDGRYVESIGFYDPVTNPTTYKIQEDRALYWLSVGAQPSDAVQRLLVKQGTTERLARVHAGESIDALSAEFYGIPFGDAVEEVVVETEVVEEVEEKGGILASIKNVVEDAAEAIEDAFDAVVDKFDGDDDETEAVAESEEADSAESEESDDEDAA